MQHTFLTNQILIICGVVVAVTLKMTSPALLSSPVYSVREMTASNVEANLARPVRQGKVAFGTERTYIT